MSQLIWLVPLLPLAGFTITGLLNKRLSGITAGVIASAAVLFSFIISLGIFFEVLQGNGIGTQTFFTWFKAGNLQIDFSFLVDQLSALMLLIVTGVGFLIHLYSIGYMKHDEGFQRFFAYLNLFIVFMLLLVLGSNYVVMFAGWEGVGLCSYLLIGFWFKNDAYNAAAKKAFIMNRIGDLGFLLGMFMIYQHFGSLDYKIVFEKAGMLAAGTPFLTAITLLLFVGATGKSAQLPLYTWLPDAMAGPTPVSALIHAATMVTAGIYMIARSNILYSLSPITLNIVLIIGVATAVFAATIGLAQNDIKKVLAYSTVSQLGFMFAALGTGSYATAMFHVTTHAFFKALLFLGAGSVIHAMSGEQDLRRMGGLKKAIPVTHLTMLIGTIAISGLPPFSGFFSKDEILLKTFEHNIFAYIILALTSAFTAFYMFRLYYLTFYGQFRGTEDQKHHLHESPSSITIPLIVLAVLSFAGGFVQMPGFHGLEEYLAPVFAASQPFLSHHELAMNTEIALMVAAVVVAVVMILIARSIYVVKKQVPAEEGMELSSVHKTIYNKYYVDEIYNFLIVRPIKFLSEVFYSVFDVRFIDGIVNNIGRGVNVGSRTIRIAQTGNIGFYVFAMVISIIIILAVSFLI